MNTRWMRRLLPALLPVLLLSPGGGAAAHTGHSTMNLICDDPNPSGASQHGGWTCSFTLNPGGDFGNTDNDKPAGFQLQLPVDAKFNEDGSHDGADPSDGENVGQMTITQLDMAYDGCGDANDGGNTYSINWEDTWRSYTAPAGWTKVAEYNLGFTVLFFFTDNMPVHVIKNTTTGQYVVEFDLPESRFCAGSVTTINPLRIYGYAQNNSSQEWVTKNPSTSGNKTVKIIATEVGGTTHDDTDTITIS